jgi:hypothetical protein
VDGEALISRPEVEAMLLAIFDVSANMKRLVDFIEGEDGGEEEEEAP